MADREPSPPASPPDPEQVEVGVAQLDGIFRVPDWLRNLGTMSWLLVGVALLGVGALYLVSLAQVIVAPLITASIVAVVASPLVARLQAWRIPRGVGSTLVLLFIVAVAAGMGVMIISGIISEGSNIADQLNTAKDDLGRWLHDLGLSDSQTDSAKSTLESGASNAVQGLLNGLVGGLSALGSLVFFLAMAALSLFFLLKDGPMIRTWVESHSGLPQPVSRVIGQRAIESLRGYFLGTTIIAVFSAVVVGIGSVLLGLPLVGTIVAVTFVAGYVPYIGAWAAGAFTVLLALGSDGPSAALAMVALQVLANGVLQQLVQPFAMGTVLGIHPLAVLVVTLAGGAIFGTMGLILAAPLVAATLRVSSDLREAREAAEREIGAGGPSAAPG